jgi:hypothetical protein
METTLMDIDNKEVYLRAKQIVELYEKRQRKKAFLDSLQIEKDEVLEYKDLTGTWYFYTQELQDNLHFEPLKIRVRKKTNSEWEIEAKELLKNFKQQ